MKISMRIILIISAIGLGVLYAAPKANTSSDQSPKDELNAPKDDLEVRFLIKPGLEGVSFLAAVPGFEFHRAAFEPDIDKTKVSIGFRFTNRNYTDAKLTIRLYDKNKKLLHEKSYIEKVGPKIRYSNRISSGRVYRTWDGFRSIRLYFPREASETTEMRIQVKLNHKQNK